MYPQAPKNTVHNTHIANSAINHRPNHKKPRQNTLHNALYNNRVVCEVKTLTPNQKTKIQELIRELKAIGEELDALRDEYKKDMTFQDQRIFELREENTELKKQLKNYEVKTSQVCPIEECREHKKIIVCVDEPEEYKLCRERFMRSLRKKYAAENTDRALKALEWEQQAQLLTARAERQRGK